MEKGSKKLKNKDEKNLFNFLKYMFTPKFYFSKWK